MRNIQDGRARDVFEPCLAPWLWRDEMRINLIDLLLPRETKFYHLLNEMGQLLVLSCHTFRDLVVKIDSLSDEEIKQRLSTIKDCEQKGDKLEVRILNELDQTFITPIDREDIQTMTLQLDKSLDILNGISRKIEMYNVKQMPQNVLKFADIITKIVDLAGELIHDLQAKKDVREKVERMHKLENDGDDQFHASMAELFSSEDKYQTIEMTKFKEIYEHLESVIDSIDYFGKLIRGIRMKQT
jgi:uncharacterized protein